MNPYVSFGLAMCAIVGLALALTAYMAVYFNRKAKSDTLAALTPLAALIDGEVDLEEGIVHGRHRGHIAEGQIALAPGRAGRIFHTSLIDAAGGSAWTWTARRLKQPGTAPELTLSDETSLPLQALAPMLAADVLPLLIEPGWLQVTYDSAAGHVRLTRPMQTRRDIPAESLFRGQLDALVGIGDENRRLQETDGADRR